MIKGEKEKYLEDADEAAVTRLQIIVSKAMHATLDRNLQVEKLSNCCMILVELHL